MVTSVDQGTPPDMHDEFRHAHEHLALRLNEPDVSGEDQINLPLTARPRIAGRLGRAVTFGGWGPRIG
ncbi:MAG TPA: hypothetical protein VKG44_11120 [Candidatus Baltobacteraceae bacterium]|nr:hypothetical protein [Candidatus Baltobacteraceae bacterium]